MSENNEGRRKEKRRKKKRVREEATESLVCLAGWVWVRMQRESLSLAWRLSTDIIGIPRLRMCIETHTLPNLLRVSSDALQVIYGWSGCGSGREGGVLCLSRDSIHAEVISRLYGFV